MTALAALALLLAAAPGAPDGGALVPPALTTPSLAPWPADAPPGSGGDVELRLTVDAAGRVTAVAVEQSPGEPFTTAAVAAAWGLRFAPATLEGAPVAVVLAYRYRFEAPPPGPPRARLAGQVLTRGTRAPVPLAQLTLGDAGTPSGETDGEGRFSLEVPPGPLELTVSASGHLPRTHREVLDAGQRLEVLYRLDRSGPRPYETTVRGQADRAELARVTLTGAELTEVAGTRGEPLRVVMLLPGVVTPASGLSYPVVRGALPAATGFYLDGVRVPQLYHLLVGSSVVHPDFIEAVDFYPSVAPTRFGRLSGGVVQAQVARARDDRPHFTLAADLLEASGFLEVPMPESGTNLAVAGRGSYAGWALGLLAGTGAFGPGVQPVFESYDYQGRLEQKLGPATVRVLAFGSSDRVGLRQLDPEQTSGFTTSAFHRVDARALVPLGPGVLEVGATYGWEQLGLSAERGTERMAAFLLGRRSWAARAQYRADLSPQWQLKVGADLERQQTDVETTAGVSGGDLLAQPRVLGTFAGAFAEASWQSGPFTVVGGARLDTWHLGPDLTVVSAEPRLQARWQVLPELLLRASAGLAHQAPMLLISLPVTDAGALRSGLQEVGQLSVGAVATLPWQDLELSAEVFYHQLFQARERSLEEFVTGISSLDSRYAGNRWGRAYGLELMLRLPQRGVLFGWLSYSLMRSERMRRFALYDATQTQVSDVTAMVPSAFDQAHTVNLVAGFQFPLGWKLSGTVHFNTGRPESGAFSSRTQRLVTVAPGTVGWQTVPLDEVDRLPAFARLDARVSKTFVQDEFTLELYLDFLNLSFATEVYGFEYGYDERGQPRKQAFGLPVALPTLGLKAVY